MSRYEIEVETTVDLDEFDTNDIISYLEDEGYVVLHSHGNSSETASSLDSKSDESSDNYLCYTSAIRNITEVCRRYEDSAHTFYQELVASLLNLPSMTDKSVLIDRFKDIL